MTIEEILSGGKEPVAGRWPTETRTGSLLLPTSSRGRSVLFLPKPKLLSAANTFHTIWKELLLAKKTKEESEATKHTPDKPLGEAKFNCASITN